VRRVKFSFRQDRRSWLGTEEGEGVKVDTTEPNAESMERVRVFAPVVRFRA